MKFSIGFISGVMVAYGSLVFGALMYKAIFKDKDDNQTHSYHISYPGCPDGGISFEDDGK